MSSPVAGAEMITFFAPASRCLAAASRLVKIPVDSITTSTPRSFHGSCAGSRTARPLKPLPSTTMSSSVADTSYGSRPRIESYFNRCAKRLVVGDVVHRHDLDVRRARHLLRLHRTPEVAADPPETVHAYPHGHACSSLPRSVVCPARLVSSRLFRVASSPVSRRRDHPIDRHRHRRRRAVASARADAACGGGRLAMHRSTRAGARAARPDRGPIIAEIRATGRGRQSRRTSPSPRSVSRPDMRGDRT